MKIVFLNFIIILSSFLALGKSDSENIERKLDGKWITNHTTQIWNFKSKTGKATLERLNNVDANVEVFDFEIYANKILFYQNDEYVFEFEVNSISKFKIQLSETESRSILFLYKLSSNVNHKNLKSDLLNNSFSFSNYKYEIESAKEAGVIQVFSNGKYNQFPNFEINLFQEIPILKIQDLTFLVISKKRKKYVIASLNGDFDILELSLNKEYINQNILRGKWKTTFEIDDNTYIDSLYLHMDFRNSDDCFQITKSRIFNPKFERNEIQFYNRFGVIKSPNQYDIRAEYLIILPKDKQKLKSDEINLIRITDNSNPDLDYKQILIKKYCD